MRMNLRVLAIFLGVSGCATTAPLSYKEQCALKGMVVKGVTSSEGSTYAFASNGTSASGFSTGESVSCEVPKTEVEKCEINIEAGAALPKFHYNRSVNTANGWIALGYLWILPGLGGYAYMDHEKQMAITASEKSRDSSYNTCQPAAASALDP